MNNVPIIKTVVILALSVGALALMISLADVSKQHGGPNADAITPQDITQAENFFKSGEASAIYSLSAVPGNMLLGGTSRSGSFFSPKLVSVSDTGAENLSFSLRSFDATAVSSVAHNGTAWLIGGGDPFLRSSSTPKLNIYDGTTFTDHSSLLSSYRGIVSASAGNETQWLLGINGVPVSGGQALEVEAGHSYTALLSFNGQTVSELVSSTQDDEFDGAHIQDIAWNGSYWLIAMESLASSDPSPVRGPLKSRLLKYDGTTLTKLEVPKYLHYSIFSLAWNGEVWLIPVYDNGTNQTDLWEYDGATFTRLSRSFANGVIVSSVLWTGEEWLLTTTTTNNIYSGINKNFQTATNLNMNAAMLWKYEAGKLETLTAPSGGMLWYDTGFDMTTHTTHLAGVGEQGHARFAALEFPPSPEFPDGTLLRAENRYEIFLIFKNKKKHVPSAEVFASYGYDLANVQTVSQETLNQIPDLKLIRLAGDPRVFHLDVGQKRWLRSEIVFESYGVPWEDILQVNALDLNSYRDARHLRSSGDERIYFITGAGFIHHVPNPESFVSYGNNWEDVVEVSTDEIKSYEVANLVRREGDFRVYLVQDGVRHWIQTQSAFQRFRYDTRKILTINATEFNSYIEGDPLQ